MADLSVLVTNKTSGDPIEAAQVKVEGKGAKLTQADGWAHWKKIQPGTYRITARKDRHLPDPGEQPSVSVPESSTTTTEIKLDLTEYHMHLDADRDGVCDGDRSGLDKWEWGKGKKGAIILCNDDGDGTTSKSDNEDDKINTGNDKDELAPLVFRRTGPLPPGWELHLKVDDKDKIRIFDTRAPGTKEIIGPSEGAKYKFPDIDFTEKEFGMEATQYADDSFDGEVLLTFTVKMTGGKSYEEKGKVRVAPWIMPNHLDPAEKVYVVETPDNAGFVAELEPLVTAAACTLVKHTNADRWMQDCMEWGYTSLPKIGIRSVLQAARDRPLKAFPKTLRKADLGYHEEAPVGDSTLDSHGNLETTPPCTSKAKKHYPFGRIYFGGTARPPDTFNSKIRSFLQRQEVQAPIELDTSWLLVAHVDEVVTFVPAPGGQGFKMLLASPRKAYDILDKAKAAHGSARMLRGRWFEAEDPPAPARWVNVETTVRDFLDYGLTSLKSVFTASDLRSYNMDRQDDIQNKIRDRLKDEIGIDPKKDIIEVPVLFADITFPLLADALTAGMVNMLVINNYCIFPKPFGPEVGGKDLFEEDLKDSLKKLGLTPRPIDDWETYHILAGEVHCGTNTLRNPSVAKWWEFEP